MNAKVVCDDTGNCRVALEGGESFCIEEKDLPESLHSGGDAQIALAPSGESAREAGARELLNYLLGIE